MDAWKNIFSNDVENPPTAGMLQQACAGRAMKLNAEEIREQNRRAIAECRIIEEATIVLEDAAQTVERAHRSMHAPNPGTPRSVQKPPSLDG